MTISATALHHYRGLNWAAFWKAGKFVKGGYKLMRAFDRFKDARNAARSQLGELKALQKKLSDQVEAVKTSSKSTKTKGSGDFCPVGGPKSFAGKTLVLMADGTRKPIAKIKVGDRVMATDPATGVTAPEVVTHVWVHTDDLTNLDLANGDVLTTTEDHPFWNATDLQWQEIADFDRGDVVVTDDWLPIEVTGLDPGSTYRDLAYNLTVANTHTYHVGESDVLVHNTGCARFATDSRGATVDMDAGSTLPAGSVRFSQRTVGGGSGSMARSMRSVGWVGDPIDVVRMADGGLTSVDN